MRLVFKATPVLPLYRSPTTGPLTDGQNVDVPEEEAERLLAQFPENFVEVKRDDDATFADDDKKRPGPSKPKRQKR